MDLAKGQRAWDQEPEKIKAETRRQVIERCPIREDNVNDYSSLMVFWWMGEIVSF